MTRNNPVIIKVDFFGDEALHKFCEHVHAPPIMKKRYLCSNMSIKPVIKHHYSFYDSKCVPEFCFRHIFSAIGAHLRITLKVNSASLPPFSDLSLPPPFLLTHPFRQLFWWYGHEVIKISLPLKCSQEGKSVAPPHL